MKHRQTLNILIVVSRLVIVAVLTLVLTGSSLGQGNEIPSEELRQELIQQALRLLSTDPLLNIRQEEAEIQDIQMAKNAAKIEATIYMHFEGILVTEDISVYAVHDGKHVRRIFREPSPDFYVYADQIPSQLLPTQRVSRWREVRAQEAAADQGSPYKLPFTGGETRTISRGGTAHNNAYDFVGDNWLVRAARGGEVKTVVEHFSGSCYDPNSNYTGTCYVHCSQECCNSANYVSVLHSDGSFGFYVHIRHNGVIPTENTFVSQGACLAYTGNTGCSAGAHLHFHVGSGLGGSYTRITWVEAPDNNPSLDGTYFTSPASQNSTAACDSCCLCTGVSIAQSGQRGSGVSAIRNETYLTLTTFPTATLSPTSTPTLPSPTATNISSSTPTSIATHTSIPTTTYTPTIIPTDTPTPTATGNPTLTSTPTASPTADTNPPHGSLAINGGTGQTKSLNVALELTANDEGSGVTEMRFSHDGTTWSEWESYEPIRAWRLSTEKGPHTVYVQFRDGAGNVSDPASATITAVLNVEKPSSESYRILSSVVGIGGGEKSSASYRVQSTTGQPSSVAWSSEFPQSSEGFQLFSGYWGAQGAAPCILTGDFDGDHDVDVNDLAFLASKWRMTVSDPEWREQYDFDGDRKVTVIDLMSLQEDWGMRCQ